MLAKPTALDRAMKKITTVRGLQTTIAIACGISPQAVHQWKRVPPHFVHDVADIIKMSPEEIRPDIFKPRKSPHR